LTGKNTKSRVIESVVQQQALLIFFFFNTLQSIELQYYDTNLKAFPGFILMINQVFCVSLTPNVRPPLYRQ